MTKNGLLKIKICVDFFVMWEMDYGMQNIDFEKI